MATVFLSLSNRAMCGTALKARPILVPDAMRSVVRLKLSICPIPPVLSNKAVILLRTIAMSA